MKLYSDVSTQQKVLYHWIARRQRCQFLDIWGRTHQTHSAKIDGVGSSRALWDMLPELRQDLVQWPGNAVSRSGLPCYQPRSFSPSSANSLPAFLQPSPERHTELLSVGSAKPISWTQVPRLVGKVLILLIRRFILDGALQLISRLTVEN